MHLNTYTSLWEFWGSGINQKLWEPWPGISNLELRTPEYLDITYQMASATGALPQVPSWGEELMWYRYPSFLTGIVAKKSPLPPWVAPVLTMNSGLVLQPMPFLTGKSPQISEDSAPPCRSSAKERAETYLGGWRSWCWNLACLPFFPKKHLPCYSQKVDAKGKWDSVQKLYKPEKCIIIK